MIVISDTSPITNLAAIGHSALLHDLYDAITIPAEVYGEMVNLDKAVPGTTEVQTLDWIQVRTVGDREQISDLQNSRENIDLGEAAAIVLAVKAKADLILIDERRGRAVAVEYGLNVVGLLGVFLQAKVRKLIPAIRPLVDQLIEEANFRVNPQLYESVMRAARELN